MGKKRLHYGMALAVLLFLWFFPALPAGARSGVPDDETLAGVCHELVGRLTAGVGDRRLERVAVSCVTPRGCPQGRHEPAGQEDSRKLVRALRDALAASDTFKLAERENLEWNQKLREKSLQGTLAGADIMRAGRELGAGWIVTGQYWWGSDGLFHLCARVFNTGDGTVAVSGCADSSAFTGFYQPMSLFEWILMGLLALVVGAITLLTLNRRCRGKLESQRVEEELDSREGFARAVIRRDPRVLEKIDAGEYEAEALAPELKRVVEALRYRAGALRVEDGKGETVQAALSEKATAFAEIFPAAASGLPEMVVFIEKGRVVLKVGPAAEVNIELDNPTFSYKLRPYPGQALVLCPGDLLGEISGSGRLRLEPVA